MTVEATVRRWYHKPWAVALLGIFLGVMFGAMIVGISGKQMWAAFKGRYLKTAAP